MRCDDVRENLVAYLDGELSDAEREAVESHLAGCPECTAERAGLESTGDLLGVLARPVESSLDIAGNVLRAAGAEEPWCGHIRRQLVAWLDGELTEKEERPVLDHLADCEGCEAEETALRRTGDALALWTVPAFETDLRPRLRRALRGGSLPLRLGPALAAACVLLLAGLAAAVLLPSSGPPPEVLENLDLYRAEADRLLEPELFEIAENIEWIEDLSDEELELLNGRGG